MTTHNFNHLENNDSTTNGKAADRSYDWLSFLKKNTVEKANEATAHMDMLRTAYKMLESAEQSMQAKDDRIKKLENLLTTDELTGLANRRGFYGAFKGELDRTNRGFSEGGLLIMIDLDKFKLTNDTYGHLAGDKALKTVGTFLKNQMRNMDVAARIGGDEFIILFSNTSISKAMERARKIGQDLNALSFDWKDQTIQIKASLGLKEYTQDDTIENIIADADKGMYEAKEKRKELQH